MVTPAHGVHVDAQALPDPYKLVSVSLVSAPKGLVGSDWHRYEICQGKNRIVGYRAGAPHSVRDAVDAIVAELNRRRTGSRGRVDVVLGKNKPKQKS